MVPGLKPKANTTIQKGLDKVIFFLVIPNITEKRVSYPHSCFRKLQ